VHAAGVRAHLRALHVDFPHVVRSRVRWFWRVGGWTRTEAGEGGALLASESNHNNHYILFCHVSFATMFLDWGSLLSVDAVFARWWHRRRATGAPAPVTTTVPYWQLLSMQVCVCVCVCVQWV
jgi:hypothetical protein